MNIANTHPSWKPLLSEALAALDPNYLEHLSTQKNWLPGPAAIFNAFSIPVEKTRFVLMGESPYPRSQSANGYAFWDNAVGNLWSDTGLSKPVNRATSLRNMIKMLLVARGNLTPGATTQDAIAKIDKYALVQTNSEFFTNLTNNGFLLLNASLSFRPKKVPVDAKAWLPFMQTLLKSLHQKNPNIELLLFGKVAEKIGGLPELSSIKRFTAEHPYNLSFIQNKQVLDYFKPLGLLDKRWKNRHNLYINSKEQ